MGITSTLSCRRLDEGQTHKQRGTAAPSPIVGSLQLGRIPVLVPMSPSCQEKQPSKPENPHRLPPPPLPPALSSQKKREGRQIAAADLEQQHSEVPCCGQKAYIEEKVSCANKKDSCGFNYQRSKPSDSALRRELNDKCFGLTS